MSNLDINDAFFSCSSSSSSDISYGSAFSEDDDSTHLRDLIQAKFSPFPKFLNIVHINAQSVPAHYPDLLSSFDSSVVHAVLISESFLKPALPSTQYSLPGYRLLRNDRTGKGGGGVAIYLRSDIPSKVIDASPGEYTQSAENLFIEISFHHTKLLLGVLYSPSSHVDYFSSFESKLESLSPLYDHTIILGDFNTCLLKSDSRADKLRAVVTSLNLNILPLAATHCAPQYQDHSLLDLIIVSESNMVATHGQLSAPFSYHDLIYLSYKIRPPKPKPKYLFLRSFKGIGVERLRADARNVDWSTVFGSDTIDDMVCSFNKNISLLYDNHAPIRRVRVKQLPSPWLSDSIRQMMARRDKAKRRYRKLPTEDNLTTYKKLRNRCNRMCRDAKRRHIHSSLEGLNTCQIWKFLNSLGIGKQLNETSFTINLDALNKHFSQAPIILNDSTKSSTLLQLSKRPLPMCTPFTFTPVTECDVKRSILSISTRAVGEDGIHLQMILLLVDELVPIITYILNFSLSKGSFPSSWRKAHVLPLPKVPNPSSFSQFRPISILPILSKVLEGLVQRQLTIYLNKNNLLNSFQSGFRQGHSTVTALLKVTDDIHHAIDVGQLTVLTLLDFSSAFNSVDFDILLSILGSLNVSPLALTWFESYLRGRSQCVRSDDATSKWCDLTAGVPQGGVLSPLLFSIFINEITQVLTSHYHLYADDLQIYRHFKADDVALAIAEINGDLGRISAWAKSFGLLVNPSKSQVIVIGSSYRYNTIDHINLPPVTLDGIPIAYSKTAKNLGIVLDCHLSWSSQINLVSRKVHCTFQSLKRLQRFLPFEAKVTLAQSLMLPLLDYADVCFLDAAEGLWDKLERLQNLCIRFIFGLRKYDHVSQYRSQLNWLPIRLRRDVHVLCMLFNILNNPAVPRYLRERFDYQMPRGVPCRTSRSLLLNFPPHSSSRYGGSFTVQSVRLWNSVPHSIRASPSLEVFRKALKKHYLSI